MQVNTIYILYIQLLVENSTVSSGCIFVIISLEKKGAERHKRVLSQFDTTTKVRVFYISFDFK